ncbi:DUF5615 family PIN-like protein [Qipengyuania aquimaris]|uniref:DUF5615 family PIN-like protein n=1 Tax=Qipengyuania aquimaris TaxID=255984 RepID=UPI001CD6C379|nr:hypothetical protein [Qipengyuania aquimaris]
MKLLVDNNLPPRLGRGLAELFSGTHHVEHIKDKFGTGSLADEDWIERLAKEGNWCVLSGDRRIASKRPSRELFLRSKLIGFFPQAALMKIPLERKASRILYLWPQMVVTSETVDRGCFGLGMKGSRLAAL